MSRDNLDSHINTILLAFTEIICQTKTDAVNRTHALIQATVALCTEIQPQKAIVLHVLGDSGGTVVKVLCYKSEGRWFDSRWCHWNFSLT